MSECPDAHRWRDAAVVACVATSFSGLGWAYLAVWALVRLNGLDADYYDAGNRFAYFLIWVVLSFLCPVAAFIGFWRPRSRGRSILRSVASGQAAALLTALPAFLLLS